MADKPKIVDLSAEKKAKQELPPNHHAFHFSMPDPDTGRELSGEFVCRRINIGQLRQLALIKAELNGGRPEESLDQAVAYLNTMMAQLRVSLVKAPEWWKPDEFFSIDIITYLFEEVMAFEATFRKAAAGRVAQDAAPDSQKQPG